MERRRRGREGMEENTMAILDSGFSRSSEYINDDKMAFLKAVRSAALVPDNGISPTNKMLEAIFQIFRDENSLELIMASYHLLIELEQRFPRVYTSEAENSESPAASSVSLDLVMVEEAWLPFNFGPETSISLRGEKQKNSCPSLDPSGFHLLIQDLTKVVNDDMEDVPLKIKFLRKMLLLQYLINVFEGDFLPRNCVNRDYMNWTLLKESLLNMLMGSKKINNKVLVKDCLLLICESYRVSLESELSRNIRGPGSSMAERKVFDSTISLSFPEMTKCTCLALQKLLLMMMKVDKSRKLADMQGLTTRADGARTPVVEIILDELFYNEDIVSRFFQVFNEPKSKLEMTVLYFRKYLVKPTVRTRRSNGSNDDATFDDILKCLSNIDSAKSMTKKMGTEVAQLLLAHAFQAFLSLSTDDSVEGGFDSQKDYGGTSLLDICKNLISAFTCLGRIDRHMGILPIGKEALFIAATILSAKS